jgi:hypothetical protein
LKKLSLIQNMNLVKENAESFLEPDNPVVCISTFLLCIRKFHKMSSPRIPLNAIFIRHLILLLIFSSKLSFSQNASINFVFVFGKQPLELEKNYAYRNDSIRISKFRFYVSEIEFLNNDKITYRVKKKHHLIDIDNKTSIQIESDSKFNFNQIQFKIGIDSITNVSGAMGGDLDPTNGMYWAWQSGYINFKLEGKCGLCNTRNNEFQLHIGGYQTPFNSLQKIKLNVKENKLINIFIDVEAFLNEINLEKNCSIMSPSLQSVKLSHQFEKLVTKNEN